MPVNAPPNKTPIIGDVQNTRPELSPFPNQNKGSIKTEWQEFFSDVFFSIKALEQSGTTAQRPTVKLYVGRPYFDTTLGLPIWYKNPGWVKADGTAA